MKKPSKTPKRRGRPLGARNKTTVARIKATERAIAAARKHLTDAEIDALGALDVMRLVMAAAIKAGDLPGALAAARDLAPFQHAKVQGIAPDTLLPADLTPDPPSCPDEPGPESPIA